MILLAPNIPNQSVEIFIRDELSSYEATLTNQDTKTKDVFTVNGAAQSEGLLTVLIPVATDMNTFYTLILRDALGDVMSYYICFSGDSLNQRYSRVGSYFNEPASTGPTYQMPK